jgi:hypothetical protein
VLRGPGREHPRVFNGFHPNVQTLLKRNARKSVRNRRYALFRAVKVNSYISVIYGSGQKVGERRSLSSDLRRSEVREAIGETRLQPPVEQFYSGLQ